MSEQTVSVSNGYFEVEMLLEKETAAEDFQREVQVSALRNGNVVATEKVEVYLAGLPSVQITSPAEGYRTSADEVQIYGETDSPANDIYVNGKWLQKGSRTFSVTAALEEGVNLLTVDAVNSQGLKSHATLRVEKDSTAPIIHFAVDYERW